MREEILVTLIDYIKALTEAIRSGQATKLKFSYRRIQIKYRKWPNGEETLDLFVRQ